jgi:hypothetical protein
MRVQDYAEPRREAIAIKRAGKYRGWRPSLTPARAAELGGDLPMATRRLACS